MTEEDKKIMLERVEDAGIKLTDADAERYCNAPDDLGPSENHVAPQGYKRCGRCGHILKLYRFNRNKDSKSNTTGNCKECQKQASKNSYATTKKKRDYKKYYQENKERKQAHSRKYYEENKDTLKVKHTEYVKSKAGQKVMQKAHGKRKEALRTNKGIPYTRAMVIDRDKQGKVYPVCYICKTAIREDESVLHLDHVIPVLIGGADCFTNIGCTHAGCNLTKKKDGTDVTAEQIQRVKKLAEAYVDANPTKFGITE